MQLFVKTTLKKGVLPRANSSLITASLSSRSKKLITLAFQIRHHTAANEGVTKRWQKSFFKLLSEKHLQNSFYTFGLALNPTNTDFICHKTAKDSQNARF